MVSIIEGFHCIWKMIWAIRECEMNIILTAECLYSLISVIEKLQVYLLMQYLQFCMYKITKRFSEWKQVHVGTEP